MSETTTIQITTEQRDALVARKTYDDEPIKAVVGRLLQEGDAGDVGPVTLEATERKAIAEEVADALR